MIIENADKNYLSEIKNELKSIYNVSQINNWKSFNPDQKIEILNSLLDYNKDGEVLDEHGKICLYERDPFLIREGTKLNLSPLHITEIKKCANDPIYFIENYVKILNLDLGYITPELRKYQKKMIQKFQKGRFFQVMMGRQSGKSVTIMLFILWCIIFSKKPEIIGLAANTQDMAVENAGRLREMYVSVPVWLKRGIVNMGKTFMSLDSGSKIYTSATTEDAFRGKGISLLFVDEVAMITKSLWSEFSSSVIPTVSSSTSAKIIYATTPKGLNHWYELWEKAKLNKDDPNLFQNIFVEWYEVPGRDENFKQLMIDTLPGGITEWYKEYECKFIGSSQTLISSKKIEELTFSQPIHYDYMKKGIKKYFKSKENCNYVISVDPYKNALDTFGIHVLDVTSIPIKQVLSGGIKVNYLEMPAVIYNLAIEYNRAFIIIENNEGAGQSIADDLVNPKLFNYKKLWYDKGKKFPGFRTTQSTRPKMLSLLEMFVNKDWLEIHHDDTIEELKHFILENNKYQAEKGYTDDLVMSLAIGLMLFGDSDKLDTLLGSSDIDKFLNHLNLNDSVFNEKQEDIDARIANLVVGFSNSVNKKQNNKEVSEIEKRKLELNKIRKKLGLEEIV